MVGCVSPFATAIRAEARAGVYGRRPAANATAGTAEPSYRAVEDVASTGVAVLSRKTALWGPPGPVQHSPCTPVDPLKFSSHPGGRLHT
jgi:hypothetical protein